LTETLRVVKFYKFTVSGLLLFCGGLNIFLTFLGIVWVYVLLEAIDNSVWNYLKFWQVELKLFLKYILFVRFLNEYQQV